MTAPGGGLRRGGLEGGGHPRVVLARTAAGAARRCECCGKVEIRLGMAILSLEDADLDGLAQAVSTFDLAAGPPPGGRYLVRFGAGSVTLAFTPDEMRQLRGLVAVARSAM